MPPIYWRGGEPLAAVRERSPVIYLLIHPMQWRANIPVNVRYAAHRVWEGMAYVLRRQLPVRDFAAFRTKLLNLDRPSDDSC
jgi:hypothetical protein